MLPFSPGSVRAGGELGAGFTLEGGEEVLHGGGINFTLSQPGMVIAWRQGCGVSVGAWPVLSKPFMWAVGGWLEGAGEATLLTWSWRDASACELPLRASAGEVLRYSH